jgi:hypothetical protein
VGEWTVHTINAFEELVDAEKNPENFTDLANNLVKMYYLMPVLHTVFFIYKLLLQSCTIK